MIKKKTKHFVTNVRPNTKIVIDGPCELIVKKANDRGQIELSFCVGLETFVETFALKQQDFENLKSKPSV